MNPLITIEQFSPEKHYETVCPWWVAQDFPVIPLTHLSSFGIAVSLKGELAGAAWLYKTDSAFCWLEFVVVNPDVRGEERSEVLTELIECAKKVSKDAGFLTMFTSVENESLISRLVKLGFSNPKRTMKNLTFNLGGV